MLADGVPVIVPTRHEDGFEPTADAIRAAFTPKTRAVIVNSPSSLVSFQPLIPVASRQAATMSSEPRSQQGVVVQTWRWYLPTGAVLNMK